MPATALDLDGRAVTLADGTVVPFDGLVIATGSGTRRLPGQEPRADRARAAHARRLARPAGRIADGTARVVVVGAGFIGLEVAATARGRGCAVTVLEGAPAPLIRGLGAAMGAAATGRPRRRRASTSAATSPSPSCSADGVRLADGALVPADVIVVGIGVAPATGVARGQRAGAARRHRLRRHAGRRPARRLRRRRRRPLAERRCSARRCASSTGRTPPSRAPRRPATCWPRPAGGVAEAVRAGAVLLERPGPPPHPVPRPQRHDEDGDVVEVVVGSPSEHRFLALYGRRGRLWGALGVNVPRLVMPYRKLLAAGVSWDDALRLAAEQRAAQQT